MNIFPAIDLRSGSAVRLFRGDYNQMKVYGDPTEQAKAFRCAGAKFLHVVDLDGAKDGTTANLDAVEKIAKNADMFIELGGGIRSMERIEKYLSIGISRVIIGTAAVNDPDFLAAALDRYGEKIAVGVDAKDDKVAISGWLEETKVDSFEFCEKLAAQGVKTVIYTDISKDGTLSGTNIAAYERLSKIAELDIVASGGISFEDEIATLRDMNVYGAILGKALYEGKIDLSRALEIAGGAKC